MLTDWICAAVAGATIDGREIKERQLEEAASSYSPQTYNARVWPEHLRSLAPDGLFKALGDVAEAKAERIKSGSLAGRLGLFVRLAPLPDLLSLVRSGQKVHLSIELISNFANTGKAYLCGLGVTDSPASLGTGMMKFNMETRKENVFSTPIQTEIDLPTDEGLNMTADEFQQIVARALKPILYHLEEQAAEIKLLNDQGDELVDMVTPFVPYGGNPPHNDREPHGGGYSERRRNIY